MQPITTYTPEEGICLSSLTQGVGQAIVQLVLPYYEAIGLDGGARAKEGVWASVCLSIEKLCNGIIPSYREKSYEAAPLQGCIGTFF